MTYWEAFVATGVDRKLNILFGKFSFSADTVLKWAMILLKCIEYKKTCSNEKFLAQLTVRYVLALKHWYSHCYHHILSPDLQVVRPALVT